MTLIVINGSENIPGDGVYDPIFSRTHSAECLELS